tara:strand:- start:292 stop:1347 length:1056 start_codon:yes stop_codon:yes gene_type:complete
MSFTEEERQSAVEMSHEYSSKYAAEVYAVHPRTIRKWRSKYKHTPSIKKEDFEVEDYQVDSEPIEELVDRRKRRFSLKNDATNSQEMINVKINLQGPIGIAHFGDPHIDDDGTNIGLLLKHADLVRKTDGMFGGNVGDVQNNWVGRLARLYGEQSTTAKESWRLTEYFLGAVEWLYLVGGNHDCWTGSGDPIEWIMGRQSGVFNNHGVRLNLVFPNKKEVRINARHDFVGRSIWNTAHGVSRAVQMGWRDHVLSAGHTHVSGYQVLKCPATGIISHALRIASYKMIDRYALEKGLPDQNIFMCPVTIIDPQYEDNDPRLVTTIFDPFEAAEFLTWKRQKWASKNTKKQKIS